MWQSYFVLLSINFCFNLHTFLGKVILAQTLFVYKNVFLHVWMSVACISRMSVAGIFRMSVAGIFRMNVVGIWDECSWYIIQVLLLKQ